jgi:hypothetical protein
MEANEMRKSMGASAVLVCGAIALAVAIAAPVASGATWTLRQLPPAYVDENSTPVSAPLSGVSCPTDSLCVAVGGLDTLAFSRAPAGGAGSWRLVHPSDPGSGGRLHAVSCASQSLCVAVSYEGVVYVSTDPAGGADAWSSTKINEGQSATHLSGVSCPSPSLCVAVSGGFGDSSGRVLTSTDPTSKQWKITPLDTSLDFRGVSCGTPSLCVAVARDGRLVASTDPTAGAQAWRELGAPGGSGDVGGVGCFADLLCAAGNEGGNILTSTNPAGGGGTWGEANAGGSVLITGVSCPAVDRCAAVDNNGDVLTSADPTAGSGAWHFENLVTFHREYGQSPRNALFGVSCPSTTLCALVGSDGRIFTSADPFSVPADRSGGSSTRQAPRRPRTFLFPTDDFWFVTHTRRRHVRAGFRFYSPTRVRGFECKRDRRSYRRCHSPLRYWAPRGRHVLRVRAIGPTGLRGRPAIKHFRVLSSRR